MNARILQEEVEALRLRVSELEAKCEAAQRADDLHLRQASALARLGTWEWEPSTDRVTWSGDMFRIYGVRHEDFTGKGSDYIKATRADYRDLQQRNLEAAWKQGVTEEAFRAGAGPIGDFKELCVVRPDGTECYTLGDAVCIVDSDGKPLRMLGITLDITERKKAEQALRESDERLQLAFQAAGFGTYSYDFGTGVGHWSAGLRAHWGIGPDDPVQLDADGIVPFLHPADRAGFLAAMTLANDRRGDGIFELEYRVIWPNSSIHWLRVRGRTEFTGEGENRRPWRANGATVDITERKRAALALQEVEILHSSIINSTPDLIWSVAPTTFGLLTFNRSLEAYFLGIGVSLQRGLTPERLFPTRDWAERWCQFYRRALREGAYSVEYETFAENRVLHLSFSVLEHDGAVFGISVFGRDITERKRSEVALQLSEEKYRNLFNNAEIGMFRSRLDGSEFLEANDKYLAILGRTREETIGKPTTVLWADPKEREAMVKTLAATGHVDALECRLLRKDGSVINCITSLRLYPEHGTVEGSIIDITERKRAEEERTRLQVQLLQVQKLESLSTLARGIAHDFNNLLGSFFGNVELARDCLLTQEPDAAMAFLDTSSKTLERARGLTQQLVTFAKGGEPILAPTDLGAFVRETTRFSLSGSKLRSEITVASNLWQCAIDQTQIGQVIDNLVVNARQAMPEGGEVHIDVRNVEYGVGESTPLVPGRYVRLTLADNGPGIAPENMGRIFDPFFSTKKGNSGLGLATSYSIVKRHSGHIAVESIPGQGATFHIFLPAVATVATSLTPHAKRSTAIAGRRILIMDDEAMVGDVMASLLRRRGAEVNTVPGGAPAIAAYETARTMGHAFDLVILDLTIPGEPGGKDVVNRLRAIDPGVRAIATSGYSDDPVIARPTDFGFVGSLRKPHTPEELEATLDAVLKL